METGILLLVLLQSRSFGLLGLNTDVYVPVYFVSSFYTGP